MNIATTPREYQWQVKCECGKEFAPVSENVSGDPLRLVCPHCKASSDFAKAQEIIRRGRWVCVAGAGSASGRASWQLPDKRFYEDSHELKICFPNSDKAVKAK